jgi:hypothetical protein
MLITNKSTTRAQMLLNLMRPIVTQQISTFRVIARIVTNDAFATAMLMVIHRVKRTVDVTSEHAQKSLGLVISEQQLNRGLVENLAWIGGCEDSTAYTIAWTRQCLKRHASHQQHLLP